MDDDDYFIVLAKILHNVLLNELYRNYVSCAPSVDLQTCPSCRIADWWTFYYKEINQQRRRRLDISGCPIFILFPYRVGGYIGWDGI